MFGDVVFNPVLNVKWVVSVSRVVRCHWHDHLLVAGVVPVERVVGAVTDRHTGLATASASRVTRIAVSSGACLLSVNSTAIGICDPVETIVQPYP